MNPSWYGDEDRQRIDDLVVANRILADQNIVDGYGHVSIRLASNPSHFFQSVSRAPELVTAGDIREFDEDSQPVAPLEPGTRLYGERFIHGEIYRVRADVQCVAHSHAFGVIPFGVSGVALRAICHQAAFLRGPVPVFEVRDAAGVDNEMLIQSNALGAAVAAALGSAPVVLMRGHGDTVVGANLRQLVFRAIYTEVNARLVMETLRLTPDPNYLNEFELKRMGDNADRFVDRPWESWKRRIAGNL